MEFQVQLPVFAGPLDLLLYLVRKHEVEVVDLPLAPITEQFLSYLEVLQQLNVDHVGDFLDLASQLMELKSRLVLPRADEVEETLDDPRQELVTRLLEYKKFKDAASLLDERSKEWQLRHARVARDQTERPLDAAEEPIQAVEMWDLVSAFGRILREKATAPTSNIRYDDTPIHVYMERIHARLKTQDRVHFRDMIEAGMHKSALVGLFLAVLELIRHYKVEVLQDGLFSDIVILAPDELKQDANLQFGQVTDYEHRQS
jgi:segregation and condensation protein A